MKQRVDSWDDIKLKGADLGSRLPVVDEKVGSSGGPMSVVVEGVSYNVFINPTLNCFRDVSGNDAGNDRRQANTFKVLQSIDFVACPGELTAIIGPSGSGKTTLLNIIAKRAKKNSKSGMIKCGGSEFSGKVFYNGRKETKKSVKTLLNYVMSTNRQLPYLTVEETLNIAADLKLKGQSKAARRAKVDAVVAECWLQSCRHNTVGGEWRKGISTGEFKRLGIAVELIDDPSLLLLDEPTSGLDSKLAFDLMRFISDLSKAGRTVICTIHQPRAQVFEMFDKVVLLGDGRLLYHGKSCEVSDYFKSIGYPPPEKYNVADFLVDVICSSTNDDERRTNVASPCLELCQPMSAGKKHVDSSPESSEFPDKTSKAVCYGGKLPTATELATLFENSPQFVELRESMNAMKNIDETFVKTTTRNRGCSAPSQCILDWFTALFCLTKRSFLNSFRNPMVCFVMALIQICQGLLLGGIFFQLSRSVQSIKPMANPFSFDTDYALDRVLDAMPLIRLGEQGANGNESHPLYDIATTPSVEIFIHDTVGCVFNFLRLEKSYPDYSNGANPQETRSLSEADSSLSSAAALSGEDRGDILLSSSLGGLSGEVPPPYNVSVVDFVQLVQTMDYYTYDYNWDWLKPCLGMAGGDLLACLMTVKIPPLLLAMVIKCGLLPSGNRMLQPEFDQSLWHLNRAENGDKSFLNKAEYGANRKVGNKNFPRLSESDVMDAVKAVATDPNKTPGYVRRHLDGLSGASSSSTGGGDPVDMFLSMLGNKKLTQLYDIIRDSLVNCNTKACDFVMTQITAANTLLNNVITTIAAVANIAGCLYFAVAYLGISSYDALLTFPQERAQFNRETASGLYRPHQFYLAKNIADFPFQLAPPLMLVTIYYFMVGLQPTVEHFFIFFGICALLSFAAYGFGYMISALSCRLEVAVVIAPIFLVLSLVLAGFFLRDPDIPKWIDWFKYLSIYRWSFFGLVTNQFPPGGYFGALPNELILEITGITDRSISRDAWYLFALGVGFRFVGYGFLKFTNRSVGVET